MTITLFFASLLHVFFMSMWWACTMPLKDNWSCECPFHVALKAEHLSARRWLRGALILYFLAAIFLYLYP